MFGRGTGGARGGPRAGWVALLASATLTLSSCNHRPAAGTPAHPQARDTTSVAYVELPSADASDANQSASEAPQGTLDSTEAKGPSSATGGFGTMVRDPRLSLASPPRSPTLLDAEQSALERLLEYTPQTSPDRPQLLRRIAEGYVELAWGRQGAERQRALRAAVDVYAAIQREFPTYARIDEVLYYMGLSHERLGDFGQARKAYYALIQAAPRSELVPLAYLGFAELFTLESGEDGTKRPLAAAAYQEVLKYPPPANRAACYARYQLGGVRRDSGDPAGAGAAFSAAQSCCASYPALPESSAIERMARQAQSAP